MSKLLVLYVFHEYNDNVKHFVEKCIFKDENIDFKPYSEERTIGSFILIDKIIFIWVSIKSCGFEIL